MDRKLKILITSCETTAGAWRGQEEMLLELYEQSDKKYNLTNDPEEAIIILIGNSRSGDWGRKIIDNPIICKYPNKSFSLSHEDKPIMLHHGLFTSTEFTIMRRGRVRTAAYNLYPKKFKNPYIKDAVNTGEYIYSQKKLLFSFIGRNSHPCREVLFQQKFNRRDVFIEDSSDFDLWNKSENKELRQKYYVEILLASKFSLCPRGSGSNTIRLFESMELGIAPVIISDAFIFPKGPDWDSFSIRIKESKISEIEEIVASYEAYYKDMGATARSEYVKWFSDAEYFNYVVDNCMDIKENQLIPESVYWAINPLHILAKKLRMKIRFKERVRHCLRKPPY